MWSWPTRIKPLCHGQKKKRHRTPTGIEPTVIDDDDNSIAYRPTYNKLKVLYHADSFGLGKLVQNNIYNNRQQSLTIHTRFGMLLILFLIAIKDYLTLVASKLYNIVLISYFRPRYVRDRDQDSRCRDQDLTPRDRDQDYGQNFKTKIKTFKMQISRSR